jgi:NurA-like 5'-3' nuclease
MENMEFLKAMLSEMNASMKANQEKADTNTKAMQEKMDTTTKAMQEMLNEMKDEIKEDMDANRKADRENLKEMMEEMMNVNQAKTNAYLKEMKEEIKFGQVEIRSIIIAWIADMKKDRKETMSCQVTTEACLDSKELNLEDMESEVEHWEIPTEEVAMKSLGTMKKWHRGRHLAAG